MSASLWRDLTDDDRQIVDEAAAASAALQLVLWRAATAEALEAVQAAGVEVIRPDKQPFADAVEAVYAEYGEDPGLLALADEIRAVE